LAYLFVGGAAAVVNFWVFLLLYSFGIALEIAAPIAFGLAAAVNYLLSVVFVFRHKAKWGNIWEIVIYCLVVLAGAAVDLFITKLFVNLGSSPALAKIIATALVLIFNFLGRRYIVFPLAGRGGWRERNQAEMDSRALTTVVGACAPRARADSGRFHP
jgi:dolichol-phosphate mannosyltransferase